MQEATWCPPTNRSVSATAEVWQHNFNITDIPYGKHSLNITARAEGEFRKGPSSTPIYRFELNKTSSVIDIFVSTNPNITFPSVQNATFQTSSLPLNFTLDHPISEMGYCLDGQEKVSIGGNTTLTGLSNGQHNVTVYTTDQLGNFDVSDTLFFNVDAPDTLPVVAVSVVATVSFIVCIGLLIYRRKSPQKERNVQS